MSLAQEYTAAQDATFIQRCQMAAVFYAINTVMSEPPTTPNYRNREIFAKAVVSNPAYWAPFLADGVIALNQSADGSLLTDTQVNNSIATIWNIYAGVL